MSRVQTVLTKTDIQMGSNPWILVNVIEENG